ncbi:MAG: DUF2283 domain-containing protein [Chloroflexi bacterium]|nr:DUF2283 domain-containing protein [Chloroflexota bacterium]
MKVIYDPETDTLTIVLREVARVVESEELREGVIADYDVNGDIVSIEVIHAERRVSDPHNIVFESRGHVSHDATSR